MLLQSHLVMLKLSTFSLRLAVASWSALGEWWSRLIRQECRNGVWLSRLSGLASTSQLTARQGEDRGLLDWTLSPLCGCTTWAGPSRWSSGHCHCPSWKGGQHQGEMGGKSSTRPVIMMVAGGINIWKIISVSNTYIYISIISSSSPYYASLSNISSPTLNLTTPRRFLLNLITTCFSSSSSLLIQITSSSFTCQEWY